MATLAHRPTLHVEAHYVYGGIIGTVAGLAMAIPAMLYSLTLGQSFFALPAGIAVPFVGAEASTTAGGILLGLMLHIALSMIVGVVFAVVVQTLLKNSVTHGLSLLWPGLAFGVAIWAFNWFLFLPAAYPDFLAVMAAGPALVFHLIFGATLALYGRVAVRH